MFNKTERMNLTSLTALSSLPKPLPYISRTLSPNNPTDFFNSTAEFHPCAVDTYD